MIGYRGPFKPVAQARMEKELCGASLRHKEPQPRAITCGYRNCNADKKKIHDDDGNTRLNPVQLTDDNFEHFVVCPKCQSVAYSIVFLWPRQQ